MVLLRAGASLFPAHGGNEEKVFFGDPVRSLVESKGVVGRNGNQAA